MSKLPLILFFPLAALCYSTCAAQDAAQATEHNMVVIREAEGGQLRAPTAAELLGLQQTQGQGLQQKRSASAHVLPVQLHIIRGADGSRAVRIGERNMVYSVVTRDSEGKLGQHCVNGVHTAVDALAQVNSDTVQQEHGEHEHANR